MLAESVATPDSNCRADRAAYGVIAAIGAFGLAAQTLLFRRFLVTFEGNELGVSLFYATWLIWVGVGAVVARRRSAWLRWAASHLEWVCLAYVPACFLQGLLIDQAREWAGVPAYQFFPMARMLPAILLANAPVSLTTGVLFVLACAWMPRASRSAVAHVYIGEAVGGFVGGLGVTLLLAGGVSESTVFFLATLVLALAGGIYRFSRCARWTAWMPVLVLAAAWGCGGARALEAFNTRHAWQRLLPLETYRGQFTTPQARYLYGEYGGQFNVVAWQSVADSIPNTEAASQVLALHLAQNPAARRFLVVGPGAFSVCHRLLSLPQAESVVWLDPDPDYPRHLLAVLPPEYAEDARRLTVPSEDVRHYLQRTRECFDLVIVGLPDAATLTANRCLTREFFELVHSRMASNAVIGVRVAGGENFMGEERINSGASVFRTLGVVFTQLAVKPGDESWVLASDMGALSQSPAELRDRFRSITNASALYPAEGLLTLYPPDRAEAQLAAYQAASEAMPDLLLNTDHHPKALLHALLQAARETGAGPPLLGALRRYAAKGFAIWPVALLILILLRLAYVHPRPGGSEVGGDFDLVWLVASTGGAGMAVSLVWLFLYQEAFGTLFLHIGLLTSVFMLGLAGGGTLCDHVLSARNWPPRRVLAGALCSHLLLLVLAGLGASMAGRGVLVVLLALSGIMSGCYVPLAVAFWRKAGVGRWQSGAAVEWSDHLGGAGGGLLAGLLLLPVFGSQYTLVFLILAVASNLVPLVTPRATEPVQMQSRTDLLIRQIAYIAIGVTVFCLWGSRLLARSEREDAAARFRQAAETLAGAEKLVPLTAGVHGGEAFALVDALTSTNSARGYVFGTAALAPDVQGYGGPLTLAVRIDTHGVLQGLRIVETHETPAYLEAVSSWLARLTGHTLFTLSPLPKMDAVTGATVSSEAVLAALRQAGPAFAREALGRKVGGPAVAERRGALPAGTILLAGLAVAALVLRRHPGSRWRWLLLVPVILGAGLVHNVQYSSSHVLAFLGTHWPAVGWGPAFALVVMVPLLVMSVGNIYCGYLCPFGLLQEVIGELRPRNWNPDPSPQVWRYARLLKYALLLVLVLGFALTRDARVASGDPLILVFGPAGSLAGTGFVIALLALALVYRRFWCRHLCPAGAFLALLNGVRLFRLWIPRVIPGRCRFGVRSERDLDCLCCDRCRWPDPDDRQTAAEMSMERTPGRDLCFVIAVAAATLMLGVMTATTVVTTWGAGRSGPRGNPSPGLRAVDLPRLQDLIDQGRLSGHEALYYRPEPASDTSAPATP